MMQNQDIRPAQVIGPLGEPLTLADLPSPKTKRWVVRRKAEVFASWQRAVDRSGMQGLRVTRIQHYRDLYERQLKY